MQVILREDIHKLGKCGDVVNVKDGFGRNFLLPRGMAILATTNNVRQMEHEKRVIAKQDAKRQKGAQSLKEKLESLNLTIARAVGEDEKLFGSVSNRDIAEALMEQGVELDRRVIELAEPIKALGMYTVTTRLTREVNANLKVWVVAK